MSQFQKSADLIDLTLNIHFSPALATNLPLPGDKKALFWPKNSLWRWDPEDIKDVCPCW